jgi:subtilisin family serine protease
MRLPLLSSVLLLAAQAATTHPVLAGGPARELVVQLSEAAIGTPGFRVTHAGAVPAAARERFRALGLRATRAMSEQLHARGRPLPEIYGFHPQRIVLLEAADAALASSALAALATDPLVDWAEPNVTRTVALAGFGVPPSPSSREAPPAPPSRRAGVHGAHVLEAPPNDPSFFDGRQYALRNLGPGGPVNGIAGADVHAVAAWRTSVGSNDIKLAVADTGIDPTHPELAGLMPDLGPRLVDTLNVSDDPTGSVVDLYGHGTPVTGVMAARTNDGAPLNPGLGIAGVCGGDGAENAGCRIVPIKIVSGHSGEASSFDIARAFLHAADVGAKAMNLSFAGEAPSRAERMALTYALLNGCIPVCAAGNSGFDFPTQPFYPAAFAYDGLAISVGASDSFDQRTPFSSYPAGLDLLAPGLEVYTTFMTYPSYFGASYPGYVPASGTSFASPHVAGAVGLLASVRPDLADTDFQHVIREAADDIGAPGFDAPTAHGRLNLERMLARVGPEIGIWHDEIPADSFTVEGEGLLRVGERGFGTMGRWYGSHWSTRLAAYGTAAIPDSFLTVTGVWLRVGGTMAARGDFEIPWFAPYAEVLRHDLESATFRGYVYRVDEDSCAGCDDRDVPLSVSSVRFGFTVMGQVDRPPVIEILSVRPAEQALPGEPFQVRYDVTDPDSVTWVTFDFESPSGARLRLGEYRPDVLGAPMVVPCLGPTATPGELVITAYDELGHADQSSVRVPYTILGGSCSAPLATFRAGPSPFASALDVYAPGAGEVRVHDASGRLVRRFATSGGPVRWDGRDDRGSAAGAGLYWVRFAGVAGEATQRVVKLGR